MLYGGRKKRGLTATFHPEQGIFRSQISCLFLGLKTRAVFPHSCLSGSDSCWVEAQAVLLLNSDAGNSWANLSSLFWGARKGDGVRNTKYINENLKWFRKQGKHISPITNVPENSATRTWGIWFLGTSEGINQSQDSFADHFCNRCKLDSKGINLALRG